MLELIILSIGLIFGIGALIFLTVILVCALKLRKAIKESKNEFNQLKEDVIEIMDMFDDLTQDEIEERINKLSDEEKLELREALTVFLELMELFKEDESL